MQGVNASPFFHGKSLVSYIYHIENDIGLYPIDHSKADTICIHMLLYVFVARCVVF